MKTSNTEATSLMQALGVKNRPSAKIFNASSMLIQITKQYSVICNAGVSITRFRGVSNIIEMHDNVVMNIITQSRQVTKPRKLLEEIQNLSTWLLCFMTMGQYISILSCDAYCRLLYCTFLSLPVKGSFNLASYLAQTNNWQYFRNLLSRGTANNGVSKNGWFSRKSSSRWFLE